MFKRKRELEKEAKELNLTPTKDLEIDETELTEEEKPHFEMPISSLIIIGGLLLVVIALIIILTFLK